LATTWERFGPSGTKQLAYLKGKLEKTPSTGTLHIQAWAQFVTRVEATAARKVFKTADVRACRGTEEQNEKYVEKLPTKAGPVESYGHFVVLTPGKSNKYDDARDALKTGMGMRQFTDENFEIFVKHPTGCEKARRNLLPRESNSSFGLDEFLWAPFTGWGIGGVGAVVFWGESGIGKTEFALSHFENPLHVTGTWQVLREFDGDQHDGIVFDDFGDELLKRTAQEGQWLCEWDHTYDCRVLYGAIHIPKHTKKIFTTNNYDGEIFRFTEGLARRMVKRELKKPGFAVKKKPAEGGRASKPSNVDDPPVRPDSSPPAEDGKHEDPTEGQLAGYAWTPMSSRDPAGNPRAAKKKSKKRSGATTTDDGALKRRKVPVIDLDDEEEPAALVRTHARSFIAVNPETRGETSGEADDAKSSNVRDLEDEDDDRSILALLGSQDDAIVAAVEEVEAEIADQAESEAQDAQDALDLAANDEAGTPPVSFANGDDVEADDAVDGSSVTELPSDDEADENDPSVAAGEDTWPLGRWNDTSDEEEDELKRMTITGVEDYVPGSFVDDEGFGDDDVPIPESPPAEDPTTSDLDFVAEVSDDETDSDALFATPEDYYDDPEEPDHEY